MRQKGFASVILVLLVLLVVGGGFYYYQTNKKSELSSNTSNFTPTVASTSVTPTSEEVKELLTPEPTQKVTTVNGALLKDIKYTLPQGWSAKLSDKNLELSSENGGYILIFVYPFPTNTGRREFYCKVSSVCIAETKFTAMKLGNISGYQPSPVDNSGGGPEYFGAKGDKFYQISTFCPLQNPDEFNSNNECNTNRTKILNSLVF